AENVPGIYVPSLYEEVEGSHVVKPMKDLNIPERVARQVFPLSDANQPTDGPVPYLKLVHDRQVLEVRRGCDRGCRFCQPGYTFLPVRERSADDLLRLSKEALQKSGHDEYSMLSLCVSDYTALHEAVSTLNREHSQKRASLSFPSQRADRMNLDVAEELKVVRKSGITLAPEAGTERLRAVINKGLSHQQIISAIESAYSSGWSSVKLYFML
ncbi:MAG: radical SAM protein, partial [Candidatus Obscuribacterales bacterium]|nr:radical SAM protein [Candidatus Obscuribacterales bacterium]